MNSASVMSEFESVELRASARTDKPKGYFKSISNEPDTGTCRDDCEKSEKCTSFRKFMAGLDPRKPLQGKEHNEKECKDLKDDLLKFLAEMEISLTDHLCNREEDQSVLQTLLTLDEGCEIITEMLDSLKNSTSSKNIEVTLGSGMLFDLSKPCGQSKILAELMGVRNRTEQGRSFDSVTALIKHPVMVIFIREKWQKIKFAFFVHLR